MNDHWRRILLEEFEGSGEGGNGSGDCGTGFQVLKGTEVVWSEEFLSLLLVLTALLYRLNVKYSCCSDQSSDESSSGINSVSSSSILNKSGVGVRHSCLNNIGKRNKIMTKTGFYSC
jgi:hypothetical protein